MKTFECKQLKKLKLQSSSQPVLLFSQLNTPTIKRTVANCK